MGWIAIYKNLKVEREDDPGVGRPVQAGENGELVVIAQEDFGHKVAIDLVNGVIALDYESFELKDGGLDLTNVRTFLSICEGETNIIGEYRHRIATEPDEKGNYTIEYPPLLWRPIWFTRFTNGVPTKVIGAQTTTPELNGSRNVKKMIAIFADGRLGID